MKRNWLWILACSLAIAGGCTSDGRVREVDGMYRKIYPDHQTGGWYYLNSHGEKVQLNQLPPERKLGEFDTRPLLEPEGP